MREIVLDTETTGLDPMNGDRIVDIGCVELINHIPTGRTYQQYINPQRSMSEEVIKVHGLTEEFLSDKPVFEQIADEFLDFIGDDSVLVIHNAPFDLKFLNAELGWAERPSLNNHAVVDTLLMARKKFPGARVNLDDLCKRFNIDNSSRSIHGALLDSQLLVDVYVELLGGKEPEFLTKKSEHHVAVINTESKPKTFHPARSFPISDLEEQAHVAFLQEIKNNFWEEA